MALFEKLSVGELTADTLLGSAGIPTGGNVFYLDTVNGSDGNNGKSPKKAFKSLEFAYSKLTANQNDVLYFLPGATANTLAAAFTWGKSYTHLIGLAAPVQIGMRCRVNATTAMTPMVTFSANGCIIKNVQFSNNFSHATTSAVCAYVTGARNYFENCHFQGLGALGVVDNSHRAIKFASSDAENRFFRCTFGADTVDGVTATNYVMEFAGTSETARQQFVECIFLGNGSANSSFILATTTSCVSSFQLFKECLFWNNDHGDMDTMTQAFNIATDCGAHFIFMDCLVQGATTLQTSNTANVVGRNAYAAGTTDSAVALTY